MRREKIVLQCEASNQCWESRIEREEDVDGIRIENRVRWDLVKRALSMRIENGIKKLIATLENGEQREGK